MRCRTARFAMGKVGARTKSRVKGLRLSPEGEVMTMLGELDAGDRAGSAANGSTTSGASFHAAATFSWSLTPLRFGSSVLRCIIS